MLHSEGREGWKLGILVRELGKRFHTFSYLPIFFSRHFPYMDIFSITVLGDLNKNWVFILVYPSAIKDSNAYASRYSVLFPST